MKRTTLALTLILAVLFTVLAGTQMVSLSEANPDWAYNGADWRYVTTITGTSSQTVDVLVPNLAHWLVDGYCLTEGDNSQIAINTNTGGTTHKITRSGTHSVGFSSFSSNRGPANVHFVIRTTNVLNYTLIVK